MTNTRAEVIYEAGKKRYIEGGINYKGFLARPVKVGVGKPYKTVGHAFFDDAWVEEFYHEYKTCYRFFVNSDVIAHDYASNDVFKKAFQEKFGTTVNDGDLTNVIGTEFEKYVIRVGDNEGGKTVVIIDKDEEQRKKDEEHDAQVLSGELPVCFFTGAFGLKASTRIPRSIWDSIKQYATYHNGDDDDIEWADDMGWRGDPRDLKGWFYQNDVVDALVAQGIKVRWNDFLVKTNLADAQKEYREYLDSERKRHNDIREVNKKTMEYYHKVKDSAEIMTVEQVKEVEDILKCKANQSLYPLIGVEGHNIYGSGMYIVHHGSYVYFVKNNGMDGDDWSLNNMGTGGAGAIVSRAWYNVNVGLFLDSYEKLENLINHR